MKFKKLLVGLVTAGLAAGSVIAGAVPAQAAWMGRIGYAYNGHTLGTLQPNGYDEQAVCINTNADIPSKRTSPKKVKNPELNYLMKKYSQTTSNTTAAALAYIVKREMDDPGFSIAKEVLSSLSSSTESAVKDKIADMWAEAKKYAGTYTMNTPSIDVAVGDDFHGTISGIGIKADSGALISGVKITLKITGAAVFDSTGTDTMTLTSSGSEQTVNWTRTSADSFKVSATSAKSLAGDYIYVHPSPSGTGDQRMVTTGPLLSVKAADPNPLPDAVTLKVDSQVGAAVIAPGGFPRDTVMVTGGPANADVTVSTSLYGPLADKPAEAADVPDGLDEVETLTDTITLDANGAGDTTLEAEHAVTASGWYVFVESVKDNPDMGLDGVTGTWARSSEMVYLYAPAKVETKASTLLAVPGATISDTATISGITEGLEGVTVKLTGELRGPIAPVGGKCEALDWSKAPLATSIDAKVITKDGDYDGLGSFTVKDGGCYSYGEKLTATVDDKPLWETDHPVGKTPQTALVYPPAQVETKASTTLALAGTTLTDTAIISGIIEGASGVTVNLTGELRGPIAPVNGSCEALDWSTAPQATTITAMPITKDGEYSGLGSFVVATTGCYSYGEKLTATVNDKPLWDTDHPVGKTPQTALVIAPAITTQIAATKTVPGAVLTDTINLTGTQAVPGEIGGQLLGPVKPVDGKCTAVDWSKAPVAQELAKIPTTADGTFTSGEFKVTKAGCYTYWETWTSTKDGTTAVNVATKPGEVTETTLIRSGNDRDGGLDVGSGFGLTGFSNPALGAAGVGGLVLLAAAGWLLIRRRNAQS